MINIQKHAELTHRFVKMQQTLNEVFYCLVKKDYEKGYEMAFNLYQEAKQAQNVGQWEELDDSKRTEEKPEAVSK